MITARIQIGDGKILDTYTGHGLIYKESDTRTEAPIKKRDVSSYAETAGENIDPRTVADAFDYKVQFIVEASNKNLENANAIIAKFNQQLYTQKQDSAVRTYQEVTFYNDYKRVKIVGYPEPIDQPKDFFRTKDGKELDCAVVEFTIRVCDPTKCDFNMAENANSTVQELPITIDIHTDDNGEYLYITTSRPLEEGEVPVLLSRGVRRNNIRNARNNKRRSMYKWHVAKPYDGDDKQFARLGENGRWEYLNGDPFDWWFQKFKTYSFDAPDENYANVPKTANSRYKLSKKRPQCKICYGVAIYKPLDMNLLSVRCKRMSNVKFFRKQFTYHWETDHLDYIYIV